jgi:hypothetical protein
MPCRKASGPLEEQPQIKPSNSTPVALHATQRRAGFLLVNMVRRVNIHNLNVSRNAPDITRILAPSSRILVLLAWAVLLWGVLGADAGQRSRVIIACDTGATSAFKPDPDRVTALMSRAMMSFTKKSTLGEAWSTIAGSNDIVGIKVFSAPGPNSGTRPAVVAPVVKGLIAAGVAPRNIIIWDRDFDDLRTAGFVQLAAELGVRVESTRGAGYDESKSYDSPLMGNLVWGDLEFGQKGEQVGRRSFVTKLVTRQLTKIISITPLLNHNVAGVAGHLWGLAFGSVDNTIRFERDRQSLNQSVPEIYALEALGDKVVLNITDALVCQYQGGERSLLHYSAALNEIRISHDPVALDALSLSELERQRKLAEIPESKPNRELFENAALLELGQNDLTLIQVERVP